MRKCLRRRYPQEQPLRVVACYPGHIRRHGQPPPPTEGMCMPHVTRLRVVSAAVAAGALTLGTLAVATAAQAGTTRREIANTHPSWAVAAKRLSSTASGTVNAKVYLAPSNRAELAQLATAVSTPKSSSFRHYLTAAAARAKFAPTSAEVASVRQWLASSGLTVTRVSAASPAGAY